MSRQQNTATFGVAAGIITVIAGAWTIFHLIWNTTNHITNDYWGQALLVLFIVGVILAFAQYFAELPALKATVSPGEQFPEPTISRFFFGSAESAPMWFVVRMNIGAQWFLLPALGLPWKAGTLFQQQPAKPSTPPASAS